jgi:hypothetical protein
MNPYGALSTEAVLIHALMGLGVGADLTLNIKTNLLSRNPASGLDRVERVEQTMYESSETLFDSFPTLDRKDKEIVHLKCRSQHISRKKSFSISM